MGSDPWKAATRYDPKIEVALGRAQSEVFARGEYGFTYKITSIYEALGMPVPELPPEPRASSIDEARQIAAESGTSSVLDVYAVGPYPAPAVTGPFSARVLRRALGTDTPSLSQLEQGLGQLYERLDRGFSAYIVCYEDGQPRHVCFIGMSFD